MNTISWVKFDVDKHGDKLLKRYERLLNSVDFYSKLKLKFEPDVKFWRKMAKEDMIGGVVGEVSTSRGIEVAAVYIYTVARVPGNKRMIQAQEVIWFVSKSFQGKGVGSQLLAAIDDHMEEAQIDLYEVNLSYGTEHTFGPKLEHMGYKPVEVKYTKRIMYEIQGD